MAMMKGAAAGAAIGALALATVLFVAPVAAQAPGGPDGSRGEGDRGSANPDMRPPGMMGPGRGDSTGRDTGITGPVPGRGDRGQDSAGRRPLDPNDPDITGPRGDVALCQQRLIAMAQARLERIQRLTRPTDDQRPALDELRTALLKGVEYMRSACPTEEALTPPARMATAEKWLEARLQATKVVRPALEAYYRTLSDEQKIRWIFGGREWGGGMARQDRGRGEDRWREQEPSFGMRRGPDQWRDRFMGPGDRFGFDRRRGDGEERWGSRRFDNDRFGPYGRRDDRWEDERYRGREPRWRDQRDQWRDQSWRDQSWRDQSWRDAPGWRGPPDWRRAPDREPNWRDQNWREPAPRGQRWRDDRDSTGGIEERL